jgi:metal-responsive CopG/Arc/MetJ family transcriptional regulator
LTSTITEIENKKRIYRHRRPPKELLGFSVTFPAWLLEAVDEASADTSRSAYIRTAVIQQLRHDIGLESVLERAGIAAGGKKQQK